MIMFLWLRKIVSGEGMGLSGGGKELKDGIF